MISYYSQTLYPRALLTEKIQFQIFFKIMLVLFAITFSVNGFGEHYIRTDLTANSTTTNVDSNLVNAWGLVTILHEPLVDFRQRHGAFHFIRS